MEPNTIALTLAFTDRGLEVHRRGCGAAGRKAVEVTDVDWTPAHLAEYRREAADLGGSDTRFHTCLD